MKIAFVGHYLRLLASSMLLVFSVVVIMFLLLELAPGDPIQGLVGQMPVTDEFRASMVEAYGLDRPIHERFIAYVANVATGNLGYSYANQASVGGLIVDRLGNTLLLTVPALVLSSVAGIVLGAIAARTRSRRVDGALSFTAIAGFSVPSFWLGLLLILIFASMLGWLPAQGMSSYTSTGVSIRHMVLPVIALAVTETAFKLRVMRSSMIEVLGQDYIDTARSKGLTGNQVLWRHGILNSMLPMVSVIGYSTGFTLAGSVLVEKVFGWPGMGLLLYESIQRSENMVVMGVLLVIAVTVVVVNILTDVVYGIVDPRVRARLHRARSA
ncbi:ABC transporter permease [Planosporangium flavigriseum]|nr:ABC transporter permease [Planosporangium flavigriseum]NJC63144.1 ABC transporter permease [Planosporangium flavigriseum]